MVSRKIDDLAPSMRPAARQLVTDCAARGVEVLIYCTLRDEHEQARLFRINRNGLAVERKAVELERRGFPDLAAILRGVGPQPNQAPGRVLTNAGPGESYHQHGLAFDCVPVVSGKLCWDGGHPAWRVIHAAALALGLERLSWDLPHIQQSGVEIVDFMLAKYGGERVAA